MYLRAVKQSNIKGTIIQSFFSSATHLSDKIPIQCCNYLNYKREVCIHKVEDIMCLRKKGKIRRAKQYERSLTIRLWLLSDINNLLFCTSIASFPGNLRGDFNKRLSLSFSEAKGRGLFSSNFFSPQNSSAASTTSSRS